MKYNFPRKSRLVTEAQFKKVYKAQQKIFSKIFTVRCCYNNANYPRMGIIVPKRNVKTAVNRNWFKRMAREVFRLKQNQFTSIDFVIVVNRDVEVSCRKEMALLLEKQMEQCVYAQKNRPNFNKPL